MISAILTVVCCIKRCLLSQER